MSDFDKELPRIPETSERSNSAVIPSEELTINWKSALYLALCKTENLQATERAWSQLCSSIRDLCPETTWITIAESHEIHNLHSVRSFQTWLEALIATPEWPFPKQVIITTSGDKNHSWKILFDKSISKIPYTTPPKGLSISPWKDKHNSGWKVMAVDTFNVNKAGEA